MITRLINGSRQQILSAALIALLAAACGGDDSGDDVDDKKDAGTQSSKDAAVPSIDASVKNDSGTSPATDAAIKADAGAVVDAAATGVDAATAADAAVVVDASTNTGMLTFNGCAAADYVDLSAPSATREITAGAGNVYVPKCITIAKGQKVTWKNNFQVHPLSPGSNATMTTTGSPNSPILAKESGSSVEYTFSTEGTYPYFCTRHVTGIGGGMAGSVHVK